MRFGQFLAALPHAADEKAVIAVARLCEEIPALALLDRRCGERDVRVAHNAVRIDDGDRLELWKALLQIDEIFMQWPRCSDFVPAHRADALVDEVNDQLICFENFEGML